MKRIVKILAVTLSLVLLAVSLAACRGASAYEIAVKNGFTGTEAEWVRSLQGANGKNYDGNAYDLYLDAKEHDGFTGTFGEFITRYFAGSDVAATDVIAKCMLSTVSLNVVSSGTLGSMKTYAGSGVIYSIDKTLGNAYIITNHHIAYPTENLASRITAFLFGSEYKNDAINCTYIGGSANYDVAVLKITHSSVIRNSNAIAATFGDSNEISLGQTIYAIGNDDGEGISVTKGILSVDSEQITLKSEVLGSTFKIREFRHDAATAPGISGGGIYDAEGKLIGIANAKTVEEEIEGMSYGIPSSAAKRLVEKIIRECNGSTATRVTIPTFNVEIAAAESKGYYNPDKAKAEIIEEVVISEVYSNAPSAVRSALYRNDIILSVSANGETKEVTRVFHVTDFILGLSVGDVFTLKINRSGTERTATILITANMMATLL